MPVGLVFESLAVLGHHPDMENQVETIRLYWDYVQIDVVPGQVPMMICSFIHIDRHL